MLSLAVLGSGKGSNLQALLEAIDTGRLDARVVLVVSDVADAYILDRARAHGVHAEHVDGAPFRTKLEGDAETRVIDLLRASGADTVALAGYMRILKKGMLAAYAGRIVNIHPSLLPAFPGLHAWEQALDYGVKVTGCTVHFVDEGTDSGPIVLQRTVEVRDEDTASSLHARIQEQEHEAYPTALQWMAEGRVTCRGRKVFVRG